MQATPTATVGQRADEFLLQAYGCWHCPLRHGMPKSGEPVGFQTMAAISKSGSHLMSLNLSGCKSITDSGVQRVAAACTSLQQLDLTRYVHSSPAQHLVYS